MMCVFRSKYLLLILSLNLLFGCSLESTGTDSKSGKTITSISSASTNNSIQSNTVLSPLKPATLGATHVLFPNVSNTGTYNLYSPELLGAVLYMGGWLQHADIGADKLYLSIFNSTTGWGALTPVHFTNPGYQEGVISGYHANDPSVVYVPQKRWHYMYYTLLNDVYQNDFDLMVSRNWVGFASSIDGGFTWTHRDVVVGQYNGIDATGAWAPSAFVANDEIWLYSHTGPYNCNQTTCDNSRAIPLRIQRHRLGLDGFSILGTDIPVDQNGSQIELANIDVRFGAGRFWMAGNTGDQKKIVLYISNDGLNFIPYDGKTGVLVDAGSKQLVITPHLSILNTNSVNLLFSIGADVPNPVFNSTHVWNFIFQ